MGGGRPTPTFTLTPAIVGIGTNVKTKIKATNNIIFFMTASCPQNIPPLPYQQHRQTPFLFSVLGSA
jgi:hypothetical protein